MLLSAIVNGVEIDDLLGTQNLIIDLQDLIIDQIQDAKFHGIYFHIGIPVR